MRPRAHPSVMTGQPDGTGRRRLALFGLAVVVLAVGAVAGATAVDTDGAADSDPDAEEVLNDTLDRYAAAESLVATANVTVTATNGSESANATAAVEFAAADNGSRVVVTGDGRTYRAGTNGSVVWYAGPNGSVAYEHEAVRERIAADNRTNATDASTEPALAWADGTPTANATNASGPAALLERARDIGDRVDVEIVRREEEDGVEAHVIRVRPADANGGRSEARATLWIAADDPRLLRAAVTDGTNATVVDVEETRFNVSVHESTFDPPGDRVAVTTFDRYGTFAAARANTSLDLPALDATFREAGVLRRSGGTLVAQRYRAGGDNVTVVSSTLDRDREYPAGNATDATNVTIDGRNATLVTLEDAAVVHWRAGDVTTAVVVEADADRALAVARKLDP